MGNGQLIAAAVMRSDVVEEFGRTARYLNTFGNNPVSCAAANRGECDGTKRHRYLVRRGE